MLGRESDHPFRLRTDTAFRGVLVHDLVVHEHVRDRVHAAGQACGHGQRAVIQENRGGQDVTGVQAGQNVAGFRVQEVIGFQLGSETVDGLGVIADHEAAIDVDDGRTTEQAA